jgi:hypothetical protein
VAVNYIPSLFEAKSIGLSNAFILSLMVTSDRKAHRTASAALLLGKLYDDRGNRMSPSFSTKNGVRY